MHRVGGLEKEDGTGNVSYEPENHDKMVRLRAAKIAGIAQRHPRCRRSTHDDGADVPAARLGRHVGRGDRGGAPCPGPRHADRARAPDAPATRSRPTSATSLRRYDTILVPELNLGQLSKLVRAEYLVDAQSLTKVPGIPFRAAEVEAKILEMMAE